MDQLSTESRALIRSNAVFKTGVDPSTLVTVLYSKFLLTPDEKSAATQKTLTDGDKLELMFTYLERRVSTDPQNFHKLLTALNDEPAMEAVGAKIKAIYDEELQNEAQQPARCTPITSSRRNGDIDVRGQCPPTPQELIDNVKITDWFRFGLELKIDDRTLHGIERDPSLQRISDKLREVFRIWLNEGEEDPTWRTVVTALKTIKENKLARDIEKKFC